jgi:hypothetical protein
MREYLLVDLSTLVGEEAEECLSLQPPDLLIFSACSNLDRSSLSSSLPNRIMRSRVLQHAVPANRSEECLCLIV